MLLLEKIPVFYLRVCSFLLCKRVHSSVVGFPGALSHVVLESFVRYCLLFNGVKSTDHNINDDLRRVFDNFKALVNSRVDINIPDGTAIHQSVTFEMLRRENSRDRNRRKSSLSSFFKYYVFLSPLNIFTSSNINSSERETASDSCFFKFLFYHLRI